MDAGNEDDHPTFAMNHPPEPNATLQQHMQEENPSVSIPHSFLQPITSTTSTISILFPPPFSFSSLPSFCDRSTDIHTVYSTYLECIQLDILIELYTSQLVRSAVIDDTHVLLRKLFGVGPHAELSPSQSQSQCKNHDHDCKPSYSCPALLHSFQSMSSISESRWESHPQLYKIQCLVLKCVERVKHLDVVLKQQASHNTQLAEELEIHGVGRDVVHNRRKT